LGPHPNRLAEVQEEDCRTFSHLCAGLTYAVIGYVTSEKTCDQSRENPPGVEEIGGD